MKKLKDRIVFNQSGVVLMTVMIILLVMSILISGVVFITMQNFSTSKKTASHTEVYYTAEGGINYLTKAFENTYGAASTVSQTSFFTSLDTFAATYPSTNKYQVNFSSNNGKTVKALVWMVKDTVSDPNTHTYTIYSEGYIGTAKRTLSKKISANYVGGGIGFKDAVFSSGPQVIGGAIVTGTVSTNSTQPGAITFSGNGSATGAFIPAGTVKETIVVCSKAYTTCIPPLGTNGIYYQTPPTIKPITILPTPTTTNKLSALTIGSGSKAIQLINSNGDFTLDNSQDFATLNYTYHIADLYPTQSVFYVPNFKVLPTKKSSDPVPTFVFDVGNKNITIVTDTLWLNGQFIVTGTGTLHFFVKPFNSLTSTNNQFQVQSTGIVGNIDHSQLMSVYIGDQTNLNNKSVSVPTQVTMSSGTYFFSVIATNLELVLNSSVLKGAIATNGLSVSIIPSSAPSAILIYAPNATVTTQGASSIFTGAIVAKNFQSVAGSSPAQIVYLDVVNSYIPIEVIDMTGITSPATTTFVKSPTLE